MQKLRFGNFFEKPKESDLDKLEKDRKYTHLSRRLIPFAFECSHCGILVEKTGRLAANAKANKKRGRLLFCSKICSGKHSSEAKIRRIKDNKGRKASK